MADGYASVRRDPASDVHGVLFDLALSDIAPLDRYEDIAHGLYTKLIQPVVRKAGGPSQALVYIGADQTVGRASIPGYMEAIVASARAVGPADRLRRDAGEPCLRPSRRRCNGKTRVLTISIATDPPFLRDHVRAWRMEGKSIALVPTMGALHAGHMRLVEEAKGLADRVVVTIFVNPTQFAPSEDFTTYPRDLEADCASVEAAGADLVYAPSTATMYPDGFATRVTVEGPATVGLEDRFRPMHFAGVATIVAKLLIQAQPDVALFGEKDFQQLRVIERVARDLDLPVRILGVPTLREGDGLALSSRNAYLSPAERATAPALHRALMDTATVIGQGGDPGAAIAKATARLAADGFVIDYVEARHSENLGPFVPGEAGRLLAAARLGRTRLIDNVGIPRR